MVSTLRNEREMSLQRVRRVVEHLRSRDYAAPLRELRFATFGKEIYFQHPDGSWEGDLQPGQIVLEKVLRLEPLKLRIERAARRPEKARGRVVRKRGVHASAPIFEGTRIRVSTVQDYLRHGFDTAAILNAFPDLDAADVRTAERMLAEAG